MAAPAGSTFELASYIEGYTGRGKVTRLQFVAKQAAAAKPAQEPLELQAYELALLALKQGTDTGKYREVVESAGARLGAGAELDAQWISQEDKRAKSTQERLEQELAVARTNSMKDSIRMGCNDLGDFQTDRGDLQNALKSYLRTRDYCSPSKYVVEMCMNVIRTSVELGNFMQVASYVTKAETTPEVAASPVDAAKFKCCSGLALLDSRKYKMAARKFCDVPAELADTFTEVIAAKDVATYGGLCALASFDRPELKERVIDEGCSFKSFLELSPHIREMVIDFYNSRYASCFTTLERLRGEMYYDLHLHDHIDTLCDQIRSRALIQVSSPYISVSLISIADAFKTDVVGVEGELAALIMEGKIHARIDSHQKIMHASQADQRQGTYSRALAMGDNYIESSHALLLRTNLMRRDFLSRPQRPTGPVSAGPGPESSYGPSGIDSD